MHKIKTVGIIGFGSMGQLIADNLTSYFSSDNIKIIEARTLPTDLEYQKINFQDLADCELIIPAVSSKNLLPVSIELHKILTSKHLVCSIAATMSYAESTLTKILPTGAELILSHPLFGPASYQQNNHKLEQLEIAVCYNYCSTSTADAATNILATAGLIVHQTSAALHDQTMSKNHLIPFMLSHLLKDYQFIKSEFKTKSFNQLLQFLDNTSYNPEVLQEIIEFNPYAKQELEKFKKLVRDYLPT